MSGSEQRIRNYRMTSRLNATEKQKFADMVEKMGFKSEGDFLRVLVLGSAPESKPKSNSKFKFARSLQITLVVHEDGRVDRRSEQV